MAPNLARLALQASAVRQALIPGLGSSAQKTLVGLSVSAPADWELTTAAVASTTLEPTTAGCPGSLHRSIPLQPPVLGRQHPRPVQLGLLPSTALSNGRAHTPLGFTFQQQQPHLQHARAASTLISFPLAQTGEGISECEVVSWHVKEGDAVGEFDKLCEVQSDKATIEITSRYSGTIRRVHYAKGDVVKVGAPLVDIEVKGEVPADAQIAATGEIAPPQVPSTAPELAQDTALHQGPGAVQGISAGDQHPHHTGKMAGGVAEVGQKAAGIARQAVAAVASTAAAAASAVMGGAPGSGGSSTTSKVLASPAVRRMAREAGVDLEALAASCPGGRVRQEDVQRYLEQRTTAAGRPSAGGPLDAGPAALAGGKGGAPQAAAPGAPHALPASPAPAIPPGNSLRVPLRGFRRAMVRHMTAALSIPHFHFHDEVSMDGLLHVRRMLKNDHGLGGTKLTLLPFIIKALSQALLQHPGLNASLAPDGSELLMHGSHNIGVAMATPSGLVVPVVRDVQGLSVAQIAQELVRLQAAAAHNKLSNADLSGGTITVSNIGSIGGLYANPIVSPPEVAIVALGRVRTVPALAPHSHHGSHSHSHGHTSSSEGSETAQVIPRSVMGVSWGADHRAVDGAALALASNAWKRLLEHPEHMLLNMR